MVIFPFLREATRKNCALGGSTTAGIKGKEDLILAQAPPYLGPDVPKAAKTLV